MGKYMRKAKMTGEVAVMEVAQSSLGGVRTRAKTLALQRLQKTTASTATATATTNSESSYLQLRSRRLQKPPLLVARNESKKQQQSNKESCNENPNPRTSSIGSVSLSCSNNEDRNSSKEATTMMVGKEEEETQENNNDVGIEASFGENFLEFEGRDRSTRETTPCSLIKSSDTIGTPGSTTSPTNSATTNRRIQNAMRRNVPTTHEMEEFFAAAEQQQQRLFTEKYNFDPVSDMPLPGRYEWVRVDP